MRRRQWWVAGTMLAVLLALPWLAPAALRMVPWFSVERVEVSGNALLSPAEVVEAAGVQSSQNLWQHENTWLEPLARNPVVASAEISRRPLRTLRIEVSEKQPVALAGAGVLRPATAAGEILPVSLARRALDLPLLPDVVQAAAGRVERPAARKLLAEVGRLAELDPRLVARTSEARSGGAGEVHLDLIEPRVELVLLHGTSAPRLRQVAAVLAELSRNAAAAGEQPGSIVVDARFRGQIVSRSTPEESTE